MSGDLVGDLVEDQLDLHAGQVCADAVVRAVAAEAQMRVGIAQDIEYEGVFEDIFIIVGRAVEQAGALALANRDATKFGVGQRRSLEAVHGRGPADDLVGGGCRPVTFVQLPLVGVFEERVHAVCHGVAGGLVAGDGEQDDEERELDVVHGFAVDVGLDEPGDDVVGRTTAALLGHRVGVAHQFGVGGRIVGLVVRVVGVHDRVGPVEQLRPIGLGHPDQIGDRQQRQAHRDVVDEVPGLLFGCGGDDFTGSDRQLLLQRGDRPRCEEPRHDLAEPGVLRRVVVDQQRLGELELFGIGAVG